MQALKFRVLVSWGAVLGSPCVLGAQQALTLKEAIAIAQERSHQAEAARAEETAEKARRRSRSASSSRPTIRRADSLGAHPKTTAQERRDGLRIAPVSVGPPPNSRIPPDSPPG